MSPRLRPGRGYRHPGRARPLPPRSRAAAAGNCAGQGAAGLRGHASAQRRPALGTRRLQPRGARPRGHRPHRPALRPHCCAPGGGREREGGAVSRAARWRAVRSAQRSRAAEGRASAALLLHRRRPAARSRKGQPPAAFGRRLIPRFRPAMLGSETKGRQRRSLPPPARVAGGLPDPPLSRKHALGSAEARTSTNHISAKRASANYPPVALRMRAGDGIRTPAAPTLRTGIRTLRTVLSWEPYPRAMHGYHEGQPRRGILQGYSLITASEKW